MAPSVPSARLLTLGQLALLDGEGRSLVPPGSTKLLSLLAFLAAAPGRRATREHIVDMLWDDSDLKGARASLRTSLHRLRQTLGPSYLPAGDDDITLTSLLTSDRDDFLAAIAAGNLEEAIDRYGGEYIPGFVSRGSAGFEHWRDNERDRLRSLFAATAETVAQRALSDDAPQVAATLAARLLAEEPLNERAWRLRLRAEQQLGSRVHLTASIAELRRLLAANEWQPEARTLQLLDSLERPVDDSDEPAEAMTLATDLVGRGPLLALLYDAWRTAARRPGVHVHLIGRAGLGKTRILEDFAARLRAERARVVRVRALPRQRFVPGAMLSAVVGALVELPGAAGMSTQSARILLPLHPSVGNRFPTATPLEFTDPDARFLALLGSFDDLLDSVSHEGACCMLLDDAHWWDDQSRRIIEQLLERLDSRPVLVVTASRPGQAIISASCTAETATLTPLSHEDVLALLQSLGEHPQALALQRFADSLTRASNGVPLIVLEAIRLGLDRGLLGLEERHWNLSRLDEFLAILHPGRLLDERLALLSAEQRQFLLTAWFLESMLTAEELPLVEADTGMAVELERLGFLASGHAGWTVAHDAIGEALEAASTAAVQQEAHRRAGLLSRHRGDSPTLLGQAARHFIDAGAREELSSTATTWLRQQRAFGSQALPMTLLRELCGASASPEVLEEILRDVPPDLKRRPWTRERVLPYALTAGLIVLASGWVISRRPPPPDAVLGVLQVDSRGVLIESHLELRQSDWALEEALPRTLAKGRPSAWSGKFMVDEGDPTKDPVLNRWVTARNLPSTSPTGPTDLILHEGGSERTLAPAPGDDVSPSWSPDGRLIAFSTTRWSAPDDAVFNLALIEVATGAIRRLTDGPDRDDSPHWSPDGTRIGFIRHPAAVGQDSLCWTSYDGAVGACQAIPGQSSLGLAGWMSPDQILVAWPEHSRTRTVSFAIDSGRRGAIDRLSPLPLILSPDRRWLVQVLSRVEGQDAGVSVAISPTATPSVRQIVQVGPGPSIPRFYWPSSDAPLGLNAVTILRRRDTISTSAPTRLALEGIDGKGRVLPFPNGVVRWASSDSTIASIGVAGDVVGHRPGVVTIAGSAGGWRQAAMKLIVRAGTADTFYSEDWRQDWAAGWKAWGNPLPRIVGRPAPGGGRALLPNGDGVHSSGLITKGNFDARDGLALDMELSTPLTRPKWQFLQLALTDGDALSPSGPMGEGCSLRYPSGEGGGNRTSLAGVPVDGTIPSGRWFRLRLQLFPDGSCGVALDGNAIRHDHVVRVTPSRMHIALGGQTIGSQLLVGRVRLLRGVPGDVDWGRVERE